MSFVFCSVVGIELSATSNFFFLYSPGTVPTFTHSACEKTACDSSKKIAAADIGNIVLKLVLLFEFDIKFSWIVRCPFTRGRK